MNKYETILTEEKDHIYIVTINRPSYKNAINARAAEELLDAFQYFDNNTELRIAILTGSGNTFCSGADLKAIASESEENLRVQEEGSAPLGVSRLEMSKPVIAAVEGHAVAGGLELALWCDLRVASQSSIFGVYCRRFGVPLVDGGTIRLPRLIGQSRAMDMILTGRPVNGTEAYAFGLVNRLVPDGESLKQSVEMAAHLSSLPQMCMRSDRLSLLEQWHLPWNEALVNETRRGVTVIQSGETLDGAQRFVKGSY